MKKSILSFFILTLLSAPALVSASVTPPERKVPVTKQFRSLNVSDNITILLTTEPATEITVQGTGAELQRARVVIKNNCLYVWMNGSVDGRNVTVRVPASQLEQIQVEGDSQVRATAILLNPKLEVTVNGACRLSLRSRGIIEVKETPDYEFRSSVR